jgi:hypothetical protein
MVANAAKLFIAKHGHAPKVNPAKSAILAAMSPEMKALILKIDAIQAELYLSRLPSEDAELRHRLAGLNLEVSRLALAEDEAALEVAERALVERREQDERDAAARAEREKEEERQAEEAEVSRKVQEHNSRIANERRIARDPIVTKQRALITELTDAKRQHAEAVASVDIMKREGFDDTFAGFCTATKHLARLAGYVSRINADIAQVTAELEALPPIDA